MSQGDDDDMVNQASAMVESDLTTEDSSEAKALFAAADELLNDTSDWDPTNKCIQSANATATTPPVINILSKLRHCDLH